MLKRDTQVGGIAKAVETHAVWTVKGSKDRRRETSECLRDMALVVDTEVMTRWLIMGWVTS